MAANRSSRVAQPRCTTADVSEGVVACLRDSSSYAATLFSALATARAHLARGRGDLAQATLWVSTRPVRLATARRYAGVSPAWLDAGDLAEAAWPEVWRAATALLARPAGDAAWPAIVTRASHRGIQAALARASVRRLSTWRDDPAPRECAAIEVATAPSPSAETEALGDTAAATRLADLCARYGITPAALAEAIESPRAQARLRQRVSRARAATRTLAPQQSPSVAAR